MSDSGRTDLRMGMATPAQPDADNSHLLVQILQELRRHTEIYQEILAELKSTHTTAFETMNIVHNRLQG